MGMLTRGSSKGQPRPGTGEGRSSGAARKMVTAAPTGCGGGERPGAYSESLGIMCRDGPLGLPLCDLLARSRPIVRRGCRCRDCRVLSLSPTADDLNPADAATGRPLGEIDHFGDPEI
jgi:hypothetical protein